ncbi:MBL fold metallo-hydrolase [Anaerosacchariphilus polymeriproducens]|uniref:MBL fold metallo-hydrolase n=1 Tax=Anaerosacchariphilus polymeriproducens TaxID=1812858 RepID=A0A371AZJ5_9FIRM|nr:MBL fold metallo-hydrolase [Anaerosacchariphilus polymeriproducens]RDU25015.1 MBL fold metallo-hydrolase [Anaerosacchariphilus polymeriproducens]
MELRITTLIENNPDDQNKLHYEHGLSLLIEIDGKRILFDTGQSGDFIQNSNKLNQDLTNLDYLLLSHGHYDHSGGFQKFVKEIHKVPQLIVGEEFFKPKYKKVSQNEYKFNGNSFDEEFIEQKNINLKKVYDEMENLTEHTFIFHHFRRNNDFEQRNSKFFIKVNSSYIPDDFDDEISLGIKTHKGLVVIVGCSHIGVINILGTIYEKVKMPIYAVIGGTHLVEADEVRIQKTIEAMRNFNIQKVAVSHCTGEEGIRCFRQEFKEQFFYNNTGRIIEI